MFQQRRPILLALTHLSSLVLYSTAIDLSCLFCCRDFGPTRFKSTVYSPADYRPCKNRPSGDEHWAPEGGWACDQSKVDFPTVDCLAADMRACGNVGNNSVFYSFGAHTIDARPFRDTLHPQGTMFNEALDDDYIKFIVNPANDQFYLSAIDVRGTSGLNLGMNRQDIWIARYSEAFAQVSTDTAYIVVLNYGGDPQYNRGGRPGSFQTPRPADLQRNPNPNQNIWGLYELPTLQRQVCTFLS